MNPPVADSEVTRMHTLRVFCEQVELFPYDVVPTTFCWACGTPAGKSAGPPLSPSHTPWMWVDPPWVEVMVHWSRPWSMCDVPVRRPELFVVVSVTPKPTCSTVAPSASPSLGVATGMATCPEGAGNLSMQKSYCCWLYLLSYQTELAVTE
jgi:hypothetical protein